MDRRDVRWHEGNDFYHRLDSNVPGRTGVKGVTPCRRRILVEPWQTTGVRLVKPALRTP